jgi:dipeptidyl aminopeptidase/acylaminoacyl peptidase
MDAEFGRPQWLLGMATYAFESPDQIVCAYNWRGRWLVGRLHAGTGTLTPLELPYTDVLPSLRVVGTQAVLGAGSPSQAFAIVRLDLSTSQIAMLRQSAAGAAEPAWLSQPRAIEFPTKGGVTAHGFFYPPKNPDYAAPAGKHPPLIVVAHGGPTGAVSTAFSPAIQFWTSRGFAVLDVNYGGSSNYGRVYRLRLNEMWGIVDVDDCINGAEYLIRQRLVDPERLAIRGGSAGGYTTLAAIAFRDVFRAGAAYFGISDLETFAKETHKFESRYLDKLVGPYPQHRDRYVARSPIHQRLSCPVIFFQGLEDAIVPPNQSERMYQALRAKGVATAYLAFEGEQHGFRRADTIRRCLEAELYFYAKVFGLELADPVEPVPIDNL